ncbi:PAS domain-containing hybrid sensor histidine kinase/response regulator [Arenicella xantha]|uniref:histidine kinase n=1 Tax=Arenicella xantha TaxID=644221 RepID=A0A395JKT6_9GAMM|nr:PAS domain-containing hybrid sensor histidine kinase/response regulator [Arenicella xantha]RBP51321.1 Na+/proline symporter [Arenicella xantha]
MFNVEFVAIIGFAYIFVLFLIAYYGDSPVYNRERNYNGNLVYALSLAVYCSSWTFYGAVGTAVVDGLDYLAIYLGPLLVFVFGYPLIRRIILICKQNRITSVSDFISSRYGKDRRIGILVTVIAVVGSLPYIALQLKALSSSFLVLVGPAARADAGFERYFSENISLVVGAVLALFTILFGTRHLDASEHHKGMILAIAFESVVKLLAILTVGYYAIYLLLEADRNLTLPQLFSLESMSNAFGGNTSTWSSFLTKLLLSTSAIFLLPRQFQVAMVEARDHHQFKTAMWVMPLYLILTSVIVIPIAISGMALMPNGAPDLYVLSLPLNANNPTIAMVAFLGGLSAATGMVIVAAISLSTMVCNELVMPYLISVKRWQILRRDNLNEIVLMIRRVAIVGLIAGAYGYFALMDNNTQLANIGLVSFAAIVQFLPAVLCALYWQRANRKGVYWGLIGGAGLWAYTLMLPTILSDAVVADLFARNALLHPQKLLGFELGNPLTHGVVWSLSVNIVMIIWFSLREPQSVIERIQASRFFNAGMQSSDHANMLGGQSGWVHPDALRILAEPIIGARNTDAVFREYQSQHGIDLTRQKQADPQLIGLIQTAIAGVIGTTSAQKVISDTLLGDDNHLEEVTNFVDETSSVLQFNRNLLQTTLQNITHGISVVDGDLNLVIWNDRYLSLFDYPEDLIYVGKPLRDLLQYNADRGDFGDKDRQGAIAKRLKHLQKRTSYSIVRRRQNGKTIKSTGEPMPNGGFVTTYEDITDSVHASELLRRANEELEDRVQARTQELEVLTEELRRNTRSKTHFLAAASHDLLQPINAARLFAHSIAERRSEPDAVQQLVHSLDQSLVTANELLRALLDISKLDAGGIQPNRVRFALGPMIDSLLRDMQASANDKNVNLRSSVDDVNVSTDKQLLHSVLQNLVSNALRYTRAGGMVTIETEVLEQNLERKSVRISVIDTGVGIAEEHLSQIFNEFYQIKSGEKQHSRGLGLGLSIVKRISRLLDLNIRVESVFGEGSRFTLELPLVDQAVVSSTSSVAPALVESDILRGAKVLCLDNDDSVLTAMQTLLRGWGCEVTSVSGYKEGLRAISQQPFDILLADYRLDYSETGLDFLCMATAIDDAEQAVGILVTAEQDDSLSSKAAALGFMYLAKPIEPAALRSLLMQSVRH